MIISILISLITWGIIFYILYWGLAKIALPEPFNKVVTVILVLATIIIIIETLTGNLAFFPFTRVI
jgi:hypothetical protein